MIVPLPLACACPGVGAAFGENPISVDLWLYVVLDSSTRRSVGAPSRRLACSLAAVPQAVLCWCRLTPESGVARAQFVEMSCEIPEQVDIEASGREPVVLALWSEPVSETRSAGAELAQVGGRWSVVGSLSSCPLLLRRLSASSHRGHI